MFGQEVRRRGRRSKTVEPLTPEIAPIIQGDMETTAQNDGLDSRTASEEQQPTNG